MPQDAKWKRKEVSGGKKQTANFEAPSKDAIFSSDISELITRMDFFSFSGVMFQGAIKVSFQYFI